MKTRREKLEELATALKTQAPEFFNSIINCQSATMKNLNLACLALSEPDAPEQTADDVWQIWELAWGNTAAAYRNGEWQKTLPNTDKFARSYLDWRKKQKPAKVPVFEITDDLVEAVCTDIDHWRIAISRNDVRKVAAAIRAATAKEPA